MEIPRYNRQVGMAEGSGGVDINPAMAGLPFAAEEKAGQVISKVGDELNRYAIVEQRAERALKAVKLEQDLKNDVDKTAESYAMRSDYDNFDKDVQTNIASLKQKHIDSIDDPVLKRAAETTFLNQSYLLQKTIRDKKRVLMGEEAQNRFDVNLTNSLKEYVYANEAEKPLIKKKIELEGYEMENSHLLKLGSTVKVMQNFDLMAQKQEIDILVRTKPEEAALLLADNKNWPLIDEGYRNTQLREARGFAATKQATLKTYIGDVHEKNMNNATDLVISGSVNINGKNVVLSREQKINMVEQMYKTEIPGSEGQRLLKHEDYKSLMTILGKVKEAKPQSDRTSLVAYTHQVNGDTIYINKYDKEEVEDAQAQGYKPGSRIIPPPKKDKIDRLTEALGGTPKGTAGSDSGKTVIRYDATGKRVK